MDAAEALATAEECPAEEPPPDDLPPLPLLLPAGLPPIPNLPLAAPNAATDDEAEAELPEESEGESRFLLSSSSGLSYVFSQYTVGNSS